MDYNQKTAEFAKKYGSETTDWVFGEAKSRSLRSKEEAAQIEKEAFEIEDGRLYVVKNGSVKQIGALTCQ